MLYLYFPISNYFIKFNNYFSNDHFYSFVFCLPQYVGIRMTTKSNILCCCFTQ